MLSRIPRWKKVLHQQSNPTWDRRVSQFVLCGLQAVQKLMDWLEKAEASNSAEVRALVDHLQAEAAQHNNQVAALQSIATALVTQVCRSPTRPLYW